MGVLRNALTKYFYLILDAESCLVNTLQRGGRSPEADYYGGPCPSCMITARVLDVGSLCRSIAGNIFAVGCAFVRLMAVGKDTVESPDDPISLVRFGPQSGYPSVFQ